MQPSYTTVVQALPNTVPFIGPESLERRIGRTIELRLGANESPFGPSPVAVEAMRAQAADAQFYGDPEGFLLRQEIARQIGVPIQNIVLSAGIDELLGQCCRLFVEAGQPVVTTHGSYPTFDYGAAGIGATVQKVPYKAEALDLATLIETSAQTQAKILYIANPDNPSGSWQSPQLLQEARKNLPETCILLLDEAYHEFAPETSPIDVDDPQVIRLRTFSKAHGMAGLRVAYMVAHEDHCQALNKIRFHFAVNCVAQAGALASLSDPHHVAQVIRKTTEGRAELTEFFTTQNLRALPSHTNFLTVDTGSKPRSEIILDKLLEQGIFIRKPALPPLDGCIRVTIGRPEQRERFAQICSELLRTV